MIDGVDSGSTTEVCAVGCESADWTGAKYGDGIIWLESGEVKSVSDYGEDVGEQEMVQDL